jgi:lysophospholipase L1-like esterase
MSLQLTCTSRLIIGDSILKNIRYVRDCNTISLSGAKIDELSRFLFFHTSILNNTECILIHCGTNNINKNTPSEIVSKLESLINKIKETNPTLTILLSAILPRPIDNTTTGESVKYVNMELKKLCPLWGVCFVASYKMMFRRGTPVEAYYQDGLHLNENGTRRLRQYFSQRLADLGKKPENDLMKSIYLRRSEWSNINQIKFAKVKY